MHDVLNDALAGSVLQQAGLELEEGEVGLSAEDFEAAQQALQVCCVLMSLCARVDVIL